MSDILNRYCELEQKRIELIQGIMLFLLDIGELDRKFRGAQTTQYWTDELGRVCINERVKTGEIPQKYFKANPNP